VKHSQISHSEFLKGIVKFKDSKQSLIPVKQNFNLPNKHHIKKQKNKDDTRFSNRCFFEF
jgi:hypothetical protein